MAFKSELFVPVIVPLQEVPNDLPISAFIAELLTKSTI